MKLLKLFSRELIAVIMISSCAVASMYASGEDDRDAEDATDAHYLVTPNLAPSDIIDCKVGLRPYRKSGIRLELEHKGDKLFVHNYGHGGSGFSLSWGCAELAVEMMQQELRRLKRQSTKKIAVIGAGVIGLTTAYLLLSRGYRVTIYTKDTTPNTTSDLSSGIVTSAMKVAVGSTLQDQANFERAKTISMEKFKELVTSTDPTVKGVSYADCYRFDPESEANPALPELATDIKAVDVHFDTGIERKALYFKNVVIDSAVYMNDLFMKVQAMGGVVKQQNFSTIDELLKLPVKVICNCMGLGAAVVFDDQDLVPLKGQVVYVKPREGANYLLHAYSGATASADQFLSYRQWNDRGIIGGTLTEGDWNDWPDQELADTLMNNLRKFVAFPKGKLHYPAK